MSDEDLRNALEGASLLFDQAEGDTAETVVDEDLSAQELVGLAQADYERLLATFYENGYFSPVVSIKLDGREAAELSPVAPPRQVARAVITVEPGRQFRFGKANIAPIPAGADVPKEFRPSEIAKLSVVQSAAKSAISDWRDAGHAKAAVAEQRITARHSAAELDVDLRVEPGPKLQFGRLNVTGTSSVAPDRIREIAGLPEGETYSPEELRDARDRLLRTTTFKSVALTEDDVPAEDGTLGVTARITDQEPRRIGFGADLSTNEGLSLRSFWVHRNIFGNADRLRIEGDIRDLSGDFTAGTDYRIGVRYTRPAITDADTDLNVLGELEQLDEPDFFSRQASAGFGFERFYSDEITYRYGLSVRTAETRNAFGDNEYSLFLIPVGARFDFRDTELDARRGYYVDAVADPFLAVVGSANGIRTTLDARTYFTFGEERPVTVALRGQLGSLFGPDLSVAPADFLYFSGGGGTVRGQEYQSLAVVLPNGQRVGGRSFLGLSAEVRLRGAGALGFVGFVDAGYIGAEEFPDGSGTWHSGAGVGLRYATGIGPIRFDLAVPTSGQAEDDSKFQVYIGIGQAF